MIQALKEGDWTGKTAVVRVNGVATRWCYRDVVEVVENAGQYLDCLMIPKVEYGTDVTFVDDLLRMIEETIGLENPIGLEVQIETATGITNIDVAAVRSRIRASSSIDRPCRAARRRNRAFVLASSFRIVMLATDSLPVCNH